VLWTVHALFCWESIQVYVCQKLQNSVEILQSYINLTSSKWKCAVFFGPPCNAHYKVLISATWSKALFLLLLPVACCVFTLGAPESLSSALPKVYQLLEHWLTEVWTWSYFTDPFAKLHWLKSAKLWHLLIPVFWTAEIFRKKNVNERCLIRVFS